MTLTLERMVVALDTVVVEGAEEPAVPVALEGFYARRERGWGLYLDRPEIEAKSPVWFTDILLNEPGVRVVAEGGNRFRIEMVGRVSLGGGPCPPTYYLNGFKYRVDPDLGINRELSANDVQAVEVYRSASETPAEFLDSVSRCGVVVIWTRRE